MKISRILGLLGSLSLISLCGGEELRISVSDLMADSLEKHLTELADQNSFEITFTKEGSLPALERLASDESDIAVIAIPDGHAMPDATRYAVYPLAYLIAAIVVNDDNPLEEVTVSQLGGIFGSNEILDYKTWGELGLSGWTGRSIKVIAAETGNSISNEIFKYTALNSKSFKSAVNMVDITSAEKAIASDVSCIGLLSRKGDASQTKTLMISSDESLPAYGPSVDNVHYGDYPLRLPFYVVFEIANKKRIKPILSYLLSENCSKLLGESGFYVLPETVRGQFSFELNMTRSE